MKLTQYIYKGPRSSASLRVDKTLIEVQLNPGKPVSLPAAHEYTEVLLKLGHLEAAPAEKPTSLTKGGK